MRQTIKEIEVHMAYRWFIGCDLFEKIPHFSAFSKNDTRRFQGTRVFERIFEKNLEEAVNSGYVDASAVFIDGTHVKASANKKKNRKVDCSIKANMKNSLLMQQTQHVTGQVLEQQRMKRAAFADANHLHGFFVRTGFRIAACADPSFRRRRRCFCAPWPDTSVYPRDGRRLPAVPGHPARRRRCSWTDADAGSPE